METVGENALEPVGRFTNEPSIKMGLLAKAPEETTNGNSSWQMEVLMEKLRSKASSLRPMPESAKMIKQAILNKQHLLDSGEQTSLRQCLDKLQQNIKVTSVSAMIERLEATARQLGLTFTSGTSGPEVYISCDMFYVEVHLQPEGKVRDVKVELAGDQTEPKGQSSPELVECLSKGNFSDFTSHLEGFLSIYQLNTEKKNKYKAYQALQALEVDLSMLFEMAQETLTDTHRLILKSPVGLLLKRKGGHPMKMVYFISPYELLDVAAGRSVSLTYETAATRDLAHYVSVNIEASTSHKLQTTSLVSIEKGNDGLKLPSISGLNSVNSFSLPACFCLKLKTPMPMSLALAQKISDITNIPCFEAATQQSLLPLIIQQASDSQLDCNNNRGLFVTLPDQQHCYFMTNGSDFQGVMVHRVPFTHPTSIVHILENLRVQALFNALITSCVRPSSKQELDSSFIFEVTAVSHDYLSVTFEHPQEESTATVELDLTDFSNVKCRIFTLNQDGSLCSDEHATKVLQRCLSIPVTMRAVMKKVAKEEKKDVMPQGDSVVMMGGGALPPDPNQNTKFLLSDYNSLGIRRENMVSPHLTNASNVVSKSPSPNQSIYGGAQSSFQNGDSFPHTLANPLSTNLPEASASVSYGPLTGGSISQKNQFPHHFLGDSKSAKVRKRKTGLESDRKSPKICDDIVLEMSAKAVDCLSTEAGLLINDQLSRRDIKVEKVPHVINKRRCSSDSGLSDAGSNELAALREKVYGAGSAANFAKLSYMHSESKDLKDLKKIKKQKSDSSTDNRKSPIVLDLTEVESSKKAALAARSASHSSALSAALLKRPGIEIIPIPGSNTPISIPSSITVTPVLKNADDKNKDKKEKKDKKDDKRDKKRRREDSPSRSSSNSSSSSSNISGNKPSKVQIISTLKHSSISTSLEKLKNDAKVSLSGVTVKSTSYQSPSKKPSLSPTISKSIVQSKVTFSPSSKSNKPIYSPSHQSSHISSSPKGTTSPKQCGSPKHPSLSPKHSSIGKPSMNTLKSTSPTFSKPSLSPKLNKGKERERGSSCSPSRLSSSPLSSSSSSSSLGSSPISSSKSKIASLVSSAAEKIKGSFSEALTITKVASGESLSTSTASSNAVVSFTSSGQSSSSSLFEKFSVDKAKASPPKNRKGSSLSDIVDKLRAGVSGSTDSLTILERKDKEKRDPSKGSDPKKDGENFTIKSSTGLKFTINKSKKESSSQRANSSLYNSIAGKSKNPVGKSSSSSSSSTTTTSSCSSGLKPGVMSAPASKKVSLSSLPPIPKLPPASVSSVSPSTISPLGNSSLPMTHSSPLQYQRERPKDPKEKDKERSFGEKSKAKDSIAFNKTSVSITDARSDPDKSVYSKAMPKEDPIPPYSVGGSNASNSDVTDAVDRALKTMFGEDDDLPEPTIQPHLHSDSGISEFFEPALTGGSGQDSDKLEPPFGHFKDIGLTSGEEKQEKAIPRSNASYMNCLPTVALDQISADVPPPLSRPMPPPPPPPPPPLNPISQNKPYEKEYTGGIPSEDLKAPLQENCMPPIPGSHGMGHPQGRPLSPPMAFPPSPSVSIKIVKSPAPVTSPLNMISPQSVSSQHSPCIIDDELMDEALMGHRK